MRRQRAEDQGAARLEIRRVSFLFLCIVGVIGMATPAFVADVAIIVMVVVGGCRCLEACLVTYCRVLTSVRARTNSWSTLQKQCILQRIKM